MNDLFNSLMTKIWKSALILLVSAIALVIAINLIASIWFWLVLIALIVAATVLLVDAYRNWRDEHRW